MKKAICLLSGGMDSIVSSLIAKQEGYDIYTLTFFYGQTPEKKELQCAEKIAKWLEAKESRVINLEWLKSIGGSALTENKKLTVDNKTAEYVPFRNTIFFSIATAWAEVIGAEAIFIGSNAGDRICPDNNLEYLKKLQDVVKVGTKLNNNIQLRAPLLEKQYDKTETIRHAMKWNVPFELTWSCHNSNEIACGICNNCIARFKAFIDAGYRDPIKYAVVPKDCEKGCT